MFVYIWSSIIDKTELKIIFRKIKFSLGSLSSVYLGFSIHYVNILYFAGNKLDREDREIPTEVGEQFAQRHNMYYLETSAKEAENVERLFIQIAAELMEVLIILFNNFAI